MKKGDKIILGIVLAAALWLAFLPNRRWQYHEISSKELLYEINQHDRYVSTDEVAKAIITHDPSYLLVDVRTPDEYAKFTLQGALNIPFDSILNPANKGFLDQDVYKVVLFSNGSTLADKAWMLLHRMGYQGTYVMQGGLNSWIETIIRPSKPAELAGEKEWEQYNFRKAASVYFGGGSDVTSDDGGSAPPPTPVVVPQKKTEGSVGGCE